MLEQIKQEYGFEDIKESDNFYRAVEFMGSDADNREFVAFLMSGMARQVMTSNRLSIHVNTGDIFYENHNTGEVLQFFGCTTKSGSCLYTKKNLHIATRLRCTLANSYRHFL